VALPHQYHRSVALPHQHHRSVALPHQYHRHVAISHQYHIGAWSHSATCVYKPICVDNPFKLTVSSMSSDHFLTWANLPPQELDGLPIHHPYAFLVCFTESFSITLHWTNLPIATLHPLPLGFQLPMLTIQYRLTTRPPLMPRGACTLTPQLTHPSAYPRYALYFNIFEA